MWKMGMVRLLYPIGIVAERLCVVLILSVLFTRSGIYPLGAMVDD